MTKMTQNELRRMTKAELINKIESMPNEADMVVKPLEHILTTMTDERALELAGQVVEAIVTSIVTSEYQRLPDATLEEMLAAGRIVKNRPAEIDDKGTKTLHVVADPRLVALHFAFQKYGEDPYVMLRELGFDPK